MAPKSVNGNIVDDTGWRPKGTGVSNVTDYVRVIKFNRDLTTKEMNEVVTWVRSEKYAGWFTAPQVTATPCKDKTGAWLFETTVDSS
jgi:hypothetical protein